MVSQSVHHCWIFGGGDNGCFIQNAHFQVFSRAVDSSPTDICTGCVSTPLPHPPFLRLWGLKCKASCILRAPCAPHARGLIRPA